MSKMKLINIQVGIIIMILFPLLILSQEQIKDDEIQDVNYIFNLTKIEIEKYELEALSEGSSDAAFKLYYYYQYIFLNLSI